MEETQYETKEKAEEKNVPVETKQPEDSKSDDEPKKPRSIAGGGSTFSGAPSSNANEVKVRKPPKMKQRRKK